MAWQWDLAHNCVLQANSNLIGRALNDFPLYNLTNNTQPSTTVTTMAQPTKQPPAEQSCSDCPTTMTAHQTNDLDSLSNSMLSQGTWFTTTTTQNKLETQTSNQLSTIMAQLETIQTLMEEQCTWQESYHKYDGYNQDQPFTQINPTWKQTIMIPTKLSQHKQLMIPRWRMPAHTNENTIRCQGFQWHRNNTNPTSPTQKIGKHQPHYSPTY